MTTATVSDARVIVRSDENDINSLDDPASSDRQLAPIPADGARYTIINTCYESLPDTPIGFAGSPYNIS